MTTPGVSAETGERAGGRTGGRADEAAGAADVTDDAATVPAGADVPATAGRWRPAHPTRWVVGSTAVVAAALRVMTALADFRTADEWTWLARSHGCKEALTDGRFGDASAGTEFPGTMPGVTTMWLGTLGDLLWSLGDRLGIVDPDSVAPSTFPTLEVAQVLMAVVTGALVGVIALLTVRWCGLVAGGVAGLLIATEPFAVAHGAVLHTDELVALCGVGGFLATALALGVPRPTPWAGRTSMAVAAGLFMAGALLTKLNAVLFFPGLALLVGWALVAVRGHGGPAPVGSAPDGGDAPAARPAPRRIGRLVAVGAGAMVAATVVAYPALWVDPLGEYDLLSNSAELGSSGHPTFFRGQATEDPGVLFYPVALAFRATPWLLAGAILAGVAIWLSRRTRGYGVALACTGVPVALGITLATKKLDRYGLVLLLLAALAVAVVADDAVGRLRRRAGPRTAPLRLAAGAGAVAWVALVAWSASLAPWGLAYYNPAVGGSARAERTVLVGWGEGLHEAVDRIAEREGGECEGVTVSAPLLRFDRLSCGEIATAESAQYLLLYVNDRQRVDPALLDLLKADRQLIDAVDQSGIRYVEIWERTGPDASPPTSEPTT